MPLYTSSSPFDRDVERATSELNAKEDVSLMNEICERAKQSSTAAKDCLRSIVKRMNNVDPHVALQALSLLDMCVIHSGHTFKLEMSSRDFISECRTLITNGKTHTYVIKRLKQLIRKWAENEFKSDSSLSLIPSLFNSLRNEGQTFPVDESMKDEDLAKAIALSLEDSGKSSTYKSLYPSASSSQSNSVPREPRKVRALYDFEAAEDNELTFKAGEILSILDDVDPNWWKGSSWRGEGLFPANFVTADLTAEIEPDIPKARKSVRFLEEVEVQVVEREPAEVLAVDEAKIDETLTLIQNADPTVETDAPELTILEEQCRSMGPLIDQELETIDRHHNTLVEVNSKLMEAFQMYHSLMQGLPNYGSFMAPPAGAPNQLFASQQYMLPPVGSQTQYVAPPQSVYQPSVYQPSAVYAQSVLANSNVYSTSTADPQLNVYANNAQLIADAQTVPQYQLDTSHQSPQHVYQSDTPVLQTLSSLSIPTAQSLL